MTAKNDRAVLDAFRFLAEALDSKDPYTLGHSDRVARYSMKIVDYLPEGKDRSFRERLLEAAFLHDVGKVRVPAKVLLKKGRLNASELFEMQLHPLHSQAVLGESMLEDSLGAIIRAHHEQPCGGGYPDGLRDEAIPLESKIISVADVFDACSSKRLYQKSATDDGDGKALSIIRQDADRGRLDKRVLSAFLEAYAAGEIHMARASAYTEATDPLIAAAGGETRSLVGLAAQFYEDACADRGEIKADVGTKYRILLRLATLHNFAGEASTAITCVNRAAMLHKRRRLTDRSIIDRDAEQTQRALALRNRGDKEQAFEIASSLLKRRVDDWIGATANLLLADISLDRGQFTRAARQANAARAAVSRLARKTEQNAQKSPLGVHLRWWSPNRVKSLEGEVALYEVRQLRRRLQANAASTARQAADLFESIDNRSRASEARSELARCLADQGEFKRARFLLGREIQFAQHTGQALDHLRRTCWMAQVAGRQAACAAKSGQRSRIAKKALSWLSDESVTETAARLRRDWLIDFSRAVVLWHTGRTAEAVEAASRVKHRLGRKSRENPMRVRSAPELIAALVLLEADAGATRRAYLDLAADARKTRRCMQELEILTAALTRFGALPNRELGRMQRTIEEMGGKAWLHQHRVYGEVLRSQGM